VATCPADDVAQPGPISAGRVPLASTTPPATPAEELFRGHAADVLTLALRLLPDAAAVEEAVREVLLRLVGESGVGRGETGLRAWLHRATVHAALRQRRRQLQPSAPAPAGPSQGPALAT
jgi:DNA-directed RNA polymerase specialized sigma24 family protein